MPSLEEKHQIIHALLACSHMQEGGSRRTLLHLLNGPFTGIYDKIDYNDKNDIHVTNIVLTCLEFSGSLEAFVNIVAEYDLETSGPVKKLRKVMFNIFFEPLVINRQLFDALIEITATLNIPRNDLKIMYQRSIDPFWQQPIEFHTIDESDLLVRILQNLTQARPLPDGKLPLIKFVALLGCVSAASIRGELVLWRKRAAEHAHVADADEVFYERNVEYEDTFSYLLVKLNPDYISQENEFYVQAWFLETDTRDENEQTYEPLTTSNSPYPIDTIEQLVNEMTSDCINKIIPVSNCKLIKNLIVEIFLPFAYLNYPDYDLHHLQIDKGFKNYRPISHVYPLIVRSLDRANCDYPKVLHAWRRNWNILQEQRAIAKPRFLDRGNCEEKISLEEDTCLAFTMAPHLIKEFHRNTSEYIFTWIISEGISIALWPRSDPSLTESQIKEAYETILAECDFSQLPQAIWKRRQQEDRCLLTKHLTLFWDDPYRVPPNDQGTGPERRKETDNE